MHEAGAQRPSTRALAGLVAVAATYNNVLNLLWPSAPTRQYVVGNTAAAAAMPATTGLLDDRRADVEPAEFGRWSGPVGARR